MNVYHTFVSIVDRIGEGDLVDILTGKHSRLQGLVQRLQGERLYILIHNNGKVSSV